MPQSITLNPALSKALYNEHLLDLENQLKEAQKELITESDPVKRHNKTKKLQDITIKYKNALEQVTNIKRQQKAIDTAKTQKLKTDEAAEELPNLEGYEELILGSTITLDKNSLTPVTLPEVKVDPDHKFKWEAFTPGPSGFPLHYINSDVKVTTGKTTDVNVQSTSYPRYYSTREASIINKYTENMDKSKLSKKLYDLVILFEVNPSKQGLAAVLDYLEYPEPWPAFDSIKNISIVNDKVVIETYDSESQIDRDLFDSVNGFGHGIQPPRHKKGESPIDKYSKSKGGEVAVQPRRSFQAGRTLRLS